MPCSHSRVTVFIAAVAIAILAGTPAFAREVQLAGIRLGDHAVNLLDIYGQPDGIALGAGEELAAAQAPAAAAGAGPDMFGPPGGGLPGDLGGLMGDLLGPMPGMGGGAAMAGPPGADIAALPEGGPGGFPGEGGAGAAPGGGGAAAGGAVAAAPFPTWALPVWVTLRSHEVEWIYRKDAVVIGFVLDRDGFVRVIAVAAEECGYARTALWQPHRYIKLGDSFKRVIYRYGYPDEQIGFSWSSPGSASIGGGSVTVTFGQVSRTYSRDMMLRYTEDNNVSFTLHNMVVTRIHIWE
jgi:hypothetical protein